MTTFLERYQQGEHELVWTELLTYGAQVYREPLFTDAWAVACATMSRARTNIERLIVRLHRLGYQFAVPDEAFRPPSPTIHAQIGRFEQTIGTLPLALKAWHLIVGSVCLIGAYPSLAFYSSKVFREVPNHYPDPLVVFPLEAAFEEYEDWSGAGELTAFDELEPFLMPLAPDEYHKENVSGGAPYEIAVPTRAVDAQLHNEWHNTTFVQYLRICFRWGGFPGWERYPERPTALLEHLAEDLLPI